MYEVIKSWYTKTRRSTGFVFPRVDYDQQWYVADFADPVKASVDTGSFKPGSYRVNPYSIKAGRVLSEESADGTSVSGNGSFSGTDQNATYDYEYGAEVENFFLVSMKRVLSDYLATHTTAYNASWGRTQALQAARAKLSGQMLTYGVEAGEFKETLQFLLNPCKSLRSLFSRRMIFGGPQSKLSHLTDAYLEFRFALQPLLGLVEDTFGLIKDGLPSFETGKIYSHHAMREDEVVVSGDTESSNSSCIYFRTTPSIVETVKYLGSVQCIYQVPPGLASMLGVSIFDVPSIVWELTRLSFIIDRYIAIGPWIESLRYQPETTILGGTTGIRRCVTVKPSLIEHKFLWGTAYKPTSLTGTSVEWNSYDRFVEEDLSTMPAINFGLSKSVTQVIDEIALILKSVK
jgi:hypothetical protein